MELPEGMTCGHCIHIRRCMLIFGHKPEDTACDWFPRKFVLDDKPKLICAACGNPAEGKSSIHRDGFGIGPEVDLCNACGLGPYPTCQELWNMIAERRGQQGEG